MPGPMSAPNGDRRLVRNPLVPVKEWDEDTERWVVVGRERLRTKLRRRNKLVTGKTAAKRK